LLLRHFHVRAFREADGVIFLSQYARDTILRRVGRCRGEVVLIPHGVDAGRRKPPRAQRRIEECSEERPLGLLYVSKVHPYNHQWTVVEAVADVRGKGWPLTLDLVGPAYGPALARLEKAVRRFDPERRWVRYRGEVDYRQIDRFYSESELFVFASSCENMPNTVIEAMASGLPIVCSDRGPMPEVLGPAGLYFNPENPATLSERLQQMILDPALRASLAEQAYRRAQMFSWERCARETFALMRRVARTHAQLAPLPQPGR
jgi:glycosyltransferase involved in cell wall biosynthesis